MHQRIFKEGNAIKRLAALNKAHGSQYRKWLAAKQKG
jgi:hypothetical protein